MPQNPYTLNIGPDGIQLVDAKTGGVIAQDGNPLYAGFVAWVADGNTPAISAELPPEPEA